MKKISLLTFILLCTFFSEMKSQDMHFSQIAESPVLLNPANTGFFSGYFRAIAQYRNQWISMGNPYSTMGISVDGNIFRNFKKSGCLGIGVTIFNDRAGAAKIGLTNINL